MLPKHIRRNGFHYALRATIASSIVVGTLYSSGCNRAHYRNRADQEVRSLVAEKLADAGTPTVRDVQVPRQSRMFDPFNPDRPPMPEDDPTAHEYMKVLNGRKHYPLWDVNGKTNTAENPVWWQYLPLDERGVLVLDANAAVRTAILHSVPFQSQVETLYLSALDVSTERFFLGNQLFAGFSTSYTADGRLRRGGGGESRSTLATGAFSRGPRGVALRRQFTTGAELIVGIANSLTWDLAGSSSQNASTIIDFNLLLPLLRGGGRDLIMERLTLAERVLLYNVRAFERYRTGFFLNVTIGRQNEQGISRRGGLFGGAGLQGFTGLGGGFGTVGQIGGVGAGAGFGGGGTVPTVGGFLGLIQAQLQIRNAEENVARLRDNLARFEDALRERMLTIPDSQVDIPTQQLQVAQARQALISSQATLLQARSNYEQTLDNFKGTLGLPPYVCVEIRDPIMDQFNLITQELLDRRNSISDVREGIGVCNSRILEQSQIRDDQATGGKYRTLAWTDAIVTETRRIEAYMQRLQNLRERLASRDISEVRSDIAKLRESVPGRQRSLARLREIYETEKDLICSLLPTSSLDVALLDDSELVGLPDILSADVDALEKRFAETQEKINKIQLDIRSILEMGRISDERMQFEQLRDQAILPAQTLLAEMAEDVLALQVIQARARIETVQLPEVDIRPEEAIQLASQLRLDWMNNRAALVDSWRSIEVVADSLESSLDVIFSGDIQNATDNPVSLRGKTGRLRAGLQWDSPLTRIQERNQYRQVLIEYQQAKRNYYRFEDAVYQTLRAELRNIRFNTFNFELQRYAVRIAAQQITINEDLRQIRESLSVASPTAARDSVDALRDLLNAQNTFLGVWVFYEAQRRTLDQDLGTIRVDEDNIWIDPGPITSETMGFFTQRNDAENMIPMEEIQVGRLPLFPSGITNSPAELNSELPVRLAPSFDTGAY
jgi:hypothetical protein